jgi:polysaccharide biosynthesis/export protein
MTRILLFFAGASLILSSCVTNKKFTYLQKEDVNPAKDQLPKDSIVRTYEVEPYEYKIQTNDIISIRFESVTTEEFDFLKNYSNVNIGGGLQGGNALLLGELVDEEGNIAFPYIGKVKVAGLTIFQIQDTLQAVISKYLQSPIVKARLLNYRITILGEVNTEGTITFGNNRVTMIEALGQAGGLTDLADKANLKLIRQLNGKTEVAYINMLDENFIHSPYYYVHQNDVLIAGPLRQRPFRKYFGQNLSLVISSLSLLLITLTLINTN